MQSDLAISLARGKLFLSALLSVITFTQKISTCCSVKMCDRAKEYILGSHSTPIYSYTFKVNSHKCTPQCHISKSVVTEIWNTKLVIVIWDIAGNLYSLFSYLESRHHHLRYKSILSCSSYFAAVPELIINLLCSFLVQSEGDNQMIYHINN